MKKERFPYELLVQIYNQRLQILWFTIAFSLTFLGAFYISLTQYTGNLGFTPLAIMLIGFLISISLFFFECRNYEIMLNNHEKYFSYIKNIIRSQEDNKNKSENELNILTKQDNCYLENKNMFSFQYNKIINFIFTVLYLAEGLSIGTVSLIAYTKYLQHYPPTSIAFIGVLAMVFILIISLLLASLSILEGSFCIRIPCTVLKYSDNEEREEIYKKNTIIRQCKIWFFVLIPISIGLILSGFIVSTEGFTASKGRASITKVWMTRK